MNKHEFIFFRLWNHLALLLSDYTFFGIKYRIDYSLEFNERKKKRIKYNIIDEQADRHQSRPSSRKSIAQRKGLFDT